jgi:hypothetical protein
MLVEPTERREMNPSTDNLKLATNEEQTQDARSQ